MNTKLSAFALALALALGLVLDAGAADSLTLDPLGVARYDSSVESPTFGRVPDHILPGNGLCGFAPAPQQGPANYEFRTVFVFSLDPADTAQPLPDLRKLKKAVLQVEITPVVGTEPRLMVDMLAPSTPDARGGIVWNQIPGFGEAMEDPLLARAEIGTFEIDLTGRLKEMIRSGEDLGGLTFRIWCDGSEFDGYPEIASHDRQEIQKAAYWMVGQPALLLEFD